MSNLHTMFSQYGVSPWLDNLSRDLIISGQLQTYVEQGIRGVTSNPSIFEKAFKESNHYSEPFAALKASGRSTEEAYWHLAIEDIQQACDALSKIYQESGSNDGFVSLEVSPELARDSAATVQQAKDLWGRVNRPNLMIKIPATEECIPAIAEVIGSGIHVNVTLIFSLHRYLQVIAAYMQGLEQCAEPSKVRSVASFFVSRVDSEVDARLADQPAMQGLAAVAQAQAAYGIYLQSFNADAERWAALLEKGAKPQRALWASTSTKNPNYPDLKYVHGLLTHNTVNTLPDATIAAIVDHADFGATGAVTAEVIEAAQETLADLKTAGIDMQEVANKLEQEGVEKFKQAFTSMLAALDV